MKDSSWYDIARERREDAREKNPKLATQATELAFKKLGNQNADVRAQFWRSVRDAIVKESQNAPDSDCREAAETLAMICFKIGHVADGHP